uniref:MbtH family NRPS accessory protein n=1 Tax=Micromonospora robiginosa TaxID=2749844 RepID=A0A7L6B412_9ACTN
MTSAIDHDAYQVVRNDEEQYSVWPARLEPPQGWYHTGFVGAREDCLAHIDQAWTDMRPLSLRRALAERAAEGSAAAPAPAPVVAGDDGPDLVTRLCAGDHPVELVLRPSPSPERLREALVAGYVHLRFPQTDGGAELGVSLTGGLDGPRADLDAGADSLTLDGELTLDFVDVSCAATVDVATLTGRARLRRR